MKRMIPALLALWILASLCACGHTEESAADVPAAPTWQEQYDLGVRYLSEGNYEEAIIAFTAAIEIDPKRVEAYEKLAETYIAYGNAEKAKSILAQGYTETGDERLQSKTWMSGLTSEEVSLLTSLLTRLEEKDRAGCWEILSSAELLHILKGGEPMFTGSSDSRVLQIGTEEAGAVISTLNAFEDHPDITCVFGRREADSSYNSERRHYTLNDTGVYYTGQTGEERYSFSVSNYVEGFSEGYCELYKFNGTSQAWVGSLETTSVSSRTISGNTVHNLWDGTVLEEHYSIFADGSENSWGLESVAIDGKASFLGLDARGNECYARNMDTGELEFGHTYIHSPGTFPYVYWPAHYSSARDPQSAARHMQILYYLPPW